MQSTNEPTTELLRRSLGSIDLSSVENEKPMTEEERKEYCAVISAVFPRIKKDVKKLMYEQLLFSSNEAETWEQVILGRGTFNGMALLLEHWEKAHQEHMSRSAPEEPPEKHSPISEL